MSKWIVGFSILAMTSLPALMKATPLRTAELDTLVVVGVAVDAAGHRLAGLTVRLVASTKAAGLLAEDRTSSNGVFNLHVSNLAGPVPNLKVVYEADDAVAKPLLVTVGLSNGDVYDVRPGDLVVMPLPTQMVGPLWTIGTQAAPLGGDVNAQALPREEVAIDHYLAAVETQDALVQAGLQEPPAAIESLKAIADRLQSAVPGFAVNGRGALNPLALQKFNQLELNALDRDVARLAMAGGRGGGSPRHAPR